MITSRAVLFGFIGGCFYLIAIVNSLPPLFYALMWLTAGILVSCFGIALLSLYGLRASWHLEAGGVAQAAPVEGFAPRDEEGEESPREVDAPDFFEAAGAGLTLEIGNAGTFGKTDIVIEVVLRPVLAVSHAALGAARQRSGRDSKKRDEEKIVRRFLIEALPSRARLISTLPLHDLDRGRYCVEAVRAVGSDVLGLFRPRRILPPASTASAISGDAISGDADECGASQVVVGPRLVRGVAGHHAGVLGVGGQGGASAAMAGRSDEFGGTRPYVAGDDLRFVHWKSTARRGEMVVREWERAVQNRSTVLWDGAALPIAERAERDTLKSKLGSSVPLLAGSEWREGEAWKAWRRGVEWSLEVAVSLSAALAGSGEPCTLWRFDEVPDFSEVASSAPPTRALQMLADAQAARLSSLHEALGASVAASGRRGRDMSGRAFVIAPVPSPSLRLVAARLGHARVTVALVDASRFESAHGRVSPGAWKAWREMMDHAEAGLREAGVRVVRLPIEPLEPIQSVGAPSSALERFHSEAATREALRALLEEAGSST